MPIDIHLLALLSGHFAGDFILQSDTMAEQKTGNPIWMLGHVLQVAALTWVLMGNLQAWPIAGMLLLLHLMVDLLKVWISRRLQRDSDGCHDHGNSHQHDPSVSGLRLFMADQALHLLTIFMLWRYWHLSGGAMSVTNHWVGLLGPDYAKALLLLSGLAVGVWGIGVVLRFQMAAFAVDLADHVQQGLPRGGKTIGLLERLLVFIFVLAGKPEGIGFVIAAKSVFRIGQLTNAREKDQAEYIMIGTLRSFTYALVVAFGVKWLLGHVG